MALKLEYRRTFIDVVESPKFLIRYHSMPALGTPLETCEDGFKEYVLKLSDPSGQGIIPRLGSSEDKIETQISSKGSLGHDWGLCKRPCALYAAGHCKHGADCGFCHMVHECRLPKLDKQQREKLKMLSVSQLLSLILEPLKMKVAEQGIEKEAKEIMALIEQEAARARGAQEKETRAGAISKRTSGAYRILTKMSIAGLVGVAGCNQADSSTFRRQCMEALERLRRQVATKVA
eukprot:s320_g8.t1